MGNMAYCRFRNTLQALRDCAEHQYDEDLSYEEHNARKRLFVLCKSIVDDMYEPNAEGELEHYGQWHKDAEDRHERYEDNDDQ